MFNRRFPKALPLGLVLLSGCAGITDITTSNPGYVALKNGDYATASQEFAQAAQETQNDAYAELDLGAAYQRMGRMDLAEPLYRRAMVDGRNVMPAETTTDWSRGLTVDQIACENLAIGLPPARLPGTAAPCQRTVVNFAVPATREPIEQMAEAMLR